jgi:hypothetical protein
MTGVTPLDRRQDQAAHPLHSLCPEPDRLFKLGATIRGPGGA